MKKIYIRSISIIVLLTGALYLLVPLKFVPSLLACSNNPDLLNIVRSGGALYITLAIVMFSLSKKPDLIMKCITAIVIIMVGLVAGRSLSIIADGVPDKTFIVSTIIESVYALWGVVILKGAKK